MVLSKLVTFSAARVRLGTSIYRSEKREPSVFPKITSTVVESGRELSTIYT